jgi:hypothetical protein
MQCVVQHLCQNLPFKFSSYYFVELFILGLEMTVTFATTAGLLSVNLPADKEYILNYDALLQISL